MQTAPMVDATRALIAGMSVIFWCFATWLVPALVAAGWWRHAVKHVLLGYTPALWSIVFPWACTRSPAPTSAGLTTFPFSKRSGRAGSGWR